MNRIFIFLTVLIIGAGSMSLKAASLAEQGDSAYSKGDYQAAVAAYSAALKEGSSAELLYNLGNAFYRQGDLGRAVLNYERALRLDPSMSDARANLAFVNTRITDKPGERGTFLGNAYDAAALAMHSNTWAWLAFAAFALFIAGIGLYFFADGIMIRKTGFFGGGIMLLLSAICAIFACHAANLASDTSTAIITAKSTILSTSPRHQASRSEEAMLLHEGTRVEILDSVVAVADSAASTWLDVRIDNTHRAWLNSADAERIVATRH